MNLHPLENEKKREQNQIQNKMTSFTRMRVVLLISLFMNISLASSSSPSSLLAATTANLNRYQRYPNSSPSDYFRRGETSIKRRNSHFANRRRVDFYADSDKERIEDTLLMSSSKKVSRNRVSRNENKPIKMTARQMKLFNLLSGGVAGTVSSVITNPLEVMKTQLQASSSAVSTSRTIPSIFQGILKKNGIAGFWRGLAPTLVGIIPSRSVYFYAYQTVSTTLPTPGSPTNALVSGLAAGICSNTLTNPIWMVRTRMQLYGTSCWSSVANLWKNEGIKGFYKGVSASYWGCTEGALQFVIYEQLKSKLIVLKNNDAEDLSKLEYFLSAAISKGLASILTYPHEVARTRLRELGSSAGGMWNCIFDIAKSEGTSGLYAGMGIHLAKVVPNSALMFLTYELVRKWLHTSVQVIDNEGK